MEKKAPEECGEGQDKDKAACGGGEEEDPRQAGEGGKSKVSVEALILACFTAPFRTEFSSATSGGLLRRSLNFFLSSPLCVSIQTAEESEGKTFALKEGKVDRSNLRPTAECKQRGVVILRRGQA